MPSEDSSSSAVLEALGYALFVRDEVGALRLAGHAPAWLAELWPAARSAGAELPVADASPFLENFLIDACECWSADAGRRVESGPWVEQDAASGEVQLQARALTVAGRACLLIERLGAAFASQVAVLQKARETVIALQRLDAEIQKKEILVHCLAGDLSGALGNIVTSLRLIELERNSPQTLQLLNLAMRGAQEQRSLIDKVLGLFPDELSGLYGGTGEIRARANLAGALNLSIEKVTASFSEKGVRLAKPDALGDEIAVVADSAHIERVLENLLRNALEHTPTGAEVAARVSEEADAVLVMIEFPHEAPLTSRSAPSSAPTPEVLLRMRFCRIALESCHGEMGSRPREGGGTCVWVRLPKWGSSE